MLVLVLTGGAAGHQAAGSEQRGKHLRAAPVWRQQEEGVGGTVAAGQPSPGADGRANHVRQTVSSFVLLTMTIFQETEYLPISEYYN